MIFKDGSINPQGIRPELLLALMIAENVYRDAGTELVITSLVDGHHSDKSLHYSGCAADLRTWHLTNPKETASKIEAALGTRHYDVIAEADHIHLEYQPRKP